MCIQALSGSWPTFRKMTCREGDLFSRQLWMDVAWVCASRKMSGSCARRAESFKQSCNSSSPPSITSTFFGRSTPNESFGRSPLVSRYSRFDLMVCCSRSCAIPGRLDSKANDIAAERRIQIDQELTDYKEQLDRGLYKTAHSR